MADVGEFANWYGKRKLEVDSYFVRACEEAVETSHERAVRRDSKHRKFSCERGRSCKPAARPLRISRRGQCHVNGPDVGNVDVSVCGGRRRRSRRNSASSALSARASARNIAACRRRR
jgi:hypothetical protein